MNSNRKCYTVITELPQTLRLTVLSNPERKYLKPIFRKLGSEVCLAKIPVVDYQGKEVTIRLGEHLACFGEGRYEICLHDECCNICDCVEVWFEADCAITQVEVLEKDCVS